MFAKLYGPDDRQILVLLGTNDEGNPSVGFLIQPEGLGVCRAELSWDDSDEGWDKAEEAFALIDEAKAEAMTAETRAAAEKMIRQS